VALGNLDNSAIKVQYARQASADITSDADIEVAPNFTVCTVTGIRGSISGGRMTGDRLLLRSFRRSLE